MPGQNTRFVNREHEIDCFLSLLQLLLSDIPITYPIREYVGIGGIGKTSLLDKFCEKCKQDQVLFIKFDFSNVSGFNAFEIIWKALYEISLQVEKIVKETCITSDAELTLSLLYKEQSDTYFPRPDSLQNLLDVLSKHFKVLFFDSVERAPCSALEYLGKELIFPLAESRRCLLVFGSRAELEWGVLKYDIRRRTSTTVLHTFPKNITRAQLIGTSIEDLYEEVQNVTNGHPLSNNIVAEILQHLISHGYEYPNQSNFGDYEQRIVTAVVDEVIQNKRLIPDSLFETFRVLSILRIFDIDLSTDFLVRIDRTKDWVDQGQKIIFFNEILTGAKDVCRFISEKKSYGIDPFIRKVLSLYMRFFYPEEYIFLSNKAVEYFDVKLKMSPKDVFFIVEKIYHLADVLRMSSPPKNDIEIAQELRSTLRYELETVMRKVMNVGTGKFQPSSEAGLNYPEEKRQLFDSLRRALEQDQELNERIGDRTTPGFLIQSLRECEKDFLFTGRAILDIVKHSISDDGMEEAYTVSFILPESKLPNDVESKIVIRLHTKQQLLDDAKVVSSVEELEDIGKFIRIQFLPPVIQNKLQLHEAPLIIRVNESSIPWELMHDGRDFIAHRIPIGKRLRTAENIKLSNHGKAQELKIFLVGAPNTKEPGFAPLKHIEGEIRALSEMIQNEPEIKFIPAKDSLLGDCSTCYSFQKALSCGRYNVIHFAGHSIFNEETDEGGVVLFDGLVDLNNIKSSIEGAPVVFLNACRSAADHSVESKVGYVGSYMLGIASAFISGGALACIGTIWDVQDEDCAKFAEKFYNECFTGITIGEALMRAKRRQRAENPNNLSWAAYVLFGDPTVKLAPHYS